jgi:hypothetical protein
MAGKKRDEVREEDLTGLKYFERLAPLLARLHAVGCQRDKAGNRILHFDQYTMLVLLFLFNPVVRSLRAMQQGQRPAEGTTQARLSAGFAGLVERGDRRFSAGTAEGGHR